MRNIFGKYVQEKLPREQGDTKVESGDGIHQLFNVNDDEDHTGEDLTRLKGISQILLFSEVL